MQFRFLHNNGSAGGKDAMYILLLKEYACSNHFLKLMLNGGREYTSKDNVLTPISTLIFLAFFLFPPYNVVLYCQNINAQGDGMIQMTVRIFKHLTQWFCLFPCYIQNMLQMDFH